MRKRVLTAVLSMIVMSLFSAHVNNVGAMEVPMKNPLWNYTAAYDVVSVSVSGDGSYVVAGSYDHQVYLFQRNGTLAWSYQTGDYVYCVSISSDGKYIVAGSRDGKVYFFSRPSSTPIWTYQTGGAVESVSISGDGGWIMAGGKDNKTRLFSRDDNTSWLEWTAGDAVFSTAISANGDYQTFAGLDNRIYFTDGRSPALWTYETDDDVLSVSISADGNYVTAGSFDHNLYVFNRNNSTPIWKYTADSAIISASISNDGNYIVAGTAVWNNIVYLFDRSNDTPLWSHNVGGAVYSVSISSDGEYVAAGSAGGKVYLFNKNSSIPIWEYTAGGLVWSVSLSSYESYLAAGSSTSCIYLFGPDSTPPDAVTLSSPTSGLATSNLMPAFNWNEGVDPSPSSGINGYYWEIDVSPSFDTINHTSVWVENKTSYTSPFSLPDGVWYWRVLAEDNYGNNGSWSSIWNLTVDTIPPYDLSVTINNGSICVNSTLVTLTLNAHEATEVSFSNDQTAWSTWESYATSKLWNLPIGDGKKYVYFRARDRAGNTATAVWSDTILDTNPPSTPTLSLPNENSLTNNALSTFSWSSSSDENGVSSYVLQIDKKTEFDSPDLRIITSITSTIYTPQTSMSDGAWYWRVSAIDDANNTGSWSSVQNFTIDSKPPTEPTLTSPNDGIDTEDEKPIFSWSAVDDTSGIAYYIIQISSSNSFISPNINSTTTETSYTPAHALTKGIWYWEVSAVDKADNVSPWSSHHNINIIEPKSNPLPVELLIGAISALLTALGVIITYLQYRTSKRRPSKHSKKNSTPHQSAN